MEMWQNQDEIQIKRQKNAQRHSPRPYASINTIFDPP